MAKCCEDACKPKLKVGDDAKVIAISGAMCGFKIGDIVDIEIDGLAGVYDLRITKNNGRNRGYCDYEHLAPIESKPALKESGRLSPGDLAKVVIQQCEHKIGHIVKIIGIEESWDIFDYHCDNLALGRDGYIDDKVIEPYTPAPGDELTVAGVKYRLEARKAKVGEKVLVVQTFCFGKFGEVHEVTGHFSDGDLITDKASRMCPERYLVLAPATSRGDHTHAIRWIDGGEDDGTKITLTLRDGFRTIETSVESGDEHTELSIDDYTLIIPHHIVKSVKVGE